MAPLSDFAQLGVAGMAIAALLSVVFFALRNAHAQTQMVHSLEALLKESQTREQSLSYSLEKSREDRLRLETIVEQNTQAWREAMQAMARVATLVEVRR